MFYILAIATGIIGAILHTIYEDRKFKKLKNTVNNVCNTIDKFTDEDYDNIALYLENDNNIKISRK